MERERILLIQTTSIKTNAIKENEKGCGGQLWPRRGPRWGLVWALGLPRVCPRPVQSLGEALVGPRWIEC